MSVGGSSSDQDVELNLASIIDCFTVLITFLLASSSFLSLGILDAGVASGGVGVEKEPTPPIHVELKILSPEEYQLKVEGKTHIDRKIASTSITDELKTLKTQYPTVDALVLSAQDDINYNEVIKSMNQIRKTYPAVMLGGFE